MVLKNLEKYRMEKGITREQLAVKAGLVSNTIRRAESGKGIHLNNARAIAKALQSRVEDLV